MGNLDLWNSLSRPPATALRQINGGRLSGKTDITPQWRYQAMTERFGPCGIGWKYTIDRLWSEPGADNQVFSFALVSVYVKCEGAWSDAIPGQGGSMLIEKERSGLYSSDEGYKMAVTDALSVALKMLGVAAEVYLGNWDGSKYKNTPPSAPSPAKTQELKTPPSELPLDQRKANAFGWLATIRDRLTDEQFTDLTASLKGCQSGAMLEAFREDALSCLKVNRDAGLFAEAFANADMAK